MPEGPEVYLNGQLVNKVCKGRFFGGKIVKSPGFKSCEITFTSAKYTISSETRGKELALTLQCDEDKDNKLRVLFRFGMSGHFKFAPVDEEIKHAHLSFFTQDDQPKMALRFVDVRRFGAWEPHDTWGVDRGPDPMFDYDNFRAHVLDNTTRRNRVLNKAICEVLLEQKFFNGIGNYLRSEILYRAGIPPFTCALTLLQQIRDDEQRGEQKSPDLLQLCRDVPMEVVNLGTGKNYDLTSSSEDHEEFNNWLQCYNNPDMECVSDHLKRTIYFKGDPGPMAPKGEGVKKKPAARAKKGTATAKKDTKKATAKKEAKQEKDETDDATTSGSKEETTTATSNGNEETATATTSDSKETTATTSRPRRGKRKAAEPKEEKAKEEEEAKEEEKVEEEEKAEEEPKPKRRKRGIKTKK